MRNEFSARISIFLLKTRRVNFHLEVLKAEDVEDADGLEVVFPFDLLVDPHDDPGETLRIKSHGNRVSRVHGLQKSGQRTRVSLDAKSGMNNKREETLQTVHSTQHTTYHHTHVISSVGRWLTLLKTCHV